VDCSICRRVPALEGNAIRVSVRPWLTAHQGGLLSGSKKGMPVNGGSFLRKRSIVLEEQLLRTPQELARIFVHEIFHFAWWRLGNERRKSFERLLIEEMRRGARGELGWSAERIKEKLTPTDRLKRTGRWRQYVCESFCDTGGWAYGSKGRYSELTLPKMFRNNRRKWLEESIAGRKLKI
jgi:hypothetical protein